jgi:hypothetical protein
MLDGWGKAINVRLDRHQQAIKGMAGIFEALQKAQAEAESATKAASPSEDSFLGKSLQKLAKAKSALRKADLADETEADLRKSHLEQADFALKSAKRLLAKAMEELEDAEEEGCEKAMAQLRTLTKALAKAEEEEKDREDAAEKAKVAKSGEEAREKIEEAKDAGEKEKKAEKEAAEAAAKSQAVTQEQILKALEGLTVLPTTVQGLVDAVMGKSQNPGGAPEITKGVVQKVDFAALIDQAIDDGRLSDGSITKAMSIVQHLHMAREGRVDQRIVDQEIEKAPAEIRDLFRSAA